MGTALLKLGAWRCPTQPMLQKWDEDKSNTLNEAGLRKGLIQILRPPDFRPPGDFSTKSAVTAKPATAKNRQKKGKQLLARSFRIALNLRSETISMPKSGDHPMKRIPFAILFATALLFSLHGTGAAQTKPTDFSGTWVLDKTKTTDLPPTLESYTLKVAQDDQQLTVQTELQGELPRRGMGGGGQGGGGGFGAGGGGGRGGGRGGGGGGGGFGGGGAGGGGGDGGGGGQGGGGGFPGGGGGFSMPKDIVMVMALRAAMPLATYKLDGKEEIIQIEARQNADQPAQPGGSIALKASWKKNGKILELQSIRKFKTQQGERSLASKDRWELSEDGKILTVKRAANAASAEEAKLVFSKQ